MNNIPVPAIPIPKRIKPALDIRRSSLFLLVLLLLFTAVAACGKKALPSPPGTDPVPAVSDLSCELDGNHVQLKWRIPSKVAEGEVIVSRASTKLSGEMCDGCPLVFQRIAVVPVRRQGGVMEQTYRDSISPGFRYTYRVVVKTDGGRTSGPSNLVTFDY